MARELVLVISGASGASLAVRFAVLALSGDTVDRLHVVATTAGLKVMAHELGEDWTLEGFCDRLPLSEEQRARVQTWQEDDLSASIASGSHPLIGVVILPCSSGTAGCLAAGVSRGLAQRVADVALKQRWPLVVGIRETPMSQILLANLQRLAEAGAHIVPPVPAYYLKPEPDRAMEVFADHYCMRVLDLLGIDVQREELRWKG